MPSLGSVEPQHDRPSPTPPQKSPSALAGADGMAMIGRDEHFDWASLVPHIVNPTKVAIIEAMWWVNEPLSATDLTKLVGDGDVNLSRISYHLRTIAEAGVIVKTGERPVRGSLEKFYFFG
jgi:hypothetical protein